MARRKAADSGTEDNKTKFTTVTNTEDFTYKRERA